VPHIRWLVLALCLMVPPVAGAADGGVYLYLQPLPPDAARLTFSMVSVSAVTGSGTEYPLAVSLKVAGPADTGKQRLLASGRLPTGSYAGFIFKVKQAGLKGDRGEVPLAVPDTPVRLDAPFAVGSPQAAVVWLVLKYQESVTTEAGFSPVFSAVAPSRPIAARAGFVTNSGSNTITVFDKGLAQAAAVIDTCAGPAGMALDQRRRRLYVACPKDDEIQAIDVVSGDILERSRVSPGDRPREVALTPDGSTLVSVNPGSNSVSFFDAVSLTRQERVNVGSGPGSILVGPTGQRAFVLNALSSSVSVIDIASRRLVATVSTDSAPLRGAFNGRGDRLYVIHDRSPYMTVLDPQQLTLVTRARLRIGVSAIAVDTVRGLVCIGGSSDTTIEFYDPNALMPIYAMKTRAGVSYLAVDAEDNRLYMVSATTQSLIVGRLADRKVASEIDVGDSPYCVAVMGEK
jgi:YVTN family beta-propeller protein